MTFGGGITVGPGITLETTSSGVGGGGGGNLGSITVGFGSMEIMGMYTIYNYGLFTLGQDSYGSSSNGAVTELTNTDNYNQQGTGQNRIRLAPGTYSGFTVASDGTINGDTTTPKVFTVGGVSATFEPSLSTQTSYSYFLYNNIDVFSLQTKNGQTLDVNVTV